MLFIPREPLCLVHGLRGVLGLYREYGFHPPELYRTEKNNFSRQILEEQLAMCCDGLIKEAFELWILMWLPDSCVMDIHRDDVKKAMFYEESE